MTPEAGMVMRCNRRVAGQRTPATSAVLGSVAGIKTSLGSPF